MTSIDKSPFTRTELQIVTSCFLGVVQQCHRADTPWAQTIAAKLRARVLAASQPDDDPCPAVQDAVPFPVPFPPPAAKRPRGKSKP